MIEQLPAAFRAMSEPMVSHDCIAFYLLAREVSKHCKVVQSGQGADELFAGYHWYPKVDGADDAFAAYRAAFFDRDHEEYLATVGERFRVEDVAGRFVRDHFASPGAEAAVDKALRLDSTIMLVDDPVKRVDNMTMAWGLEARVPFLDYRLAELSARIPARFKLGDGGKQVLKGAARKVIPSEVIDRPKGYFPVPGLKHLQGRTREWVRAAARPEPGPRPVPAGDIRSPAERSGRRPHRCAAQAVAAGRPQPLAQRTGTLKMGPNAGARTRSDHERPLASASPAQPAPATYPGAHLRTPAGASRRRSQRAHRETAEHPLRLGPPADRADLPGRRGTGPRPATGSPGERDIALYVAAPRQVLAHAPQQLFLDPSDTLRLWFTDYRPARRPPRGFRIRRVHTEEDWAAINRLYLARGMLPVQTERLSPRHQGGPIYWLAEDADTGVAVGTVMGLNHAKAFQDPEGGSSLWCLAVDPQCSRPGVGEALVRHLVEHFMSRELAYLDLSVLHNNQQAKALYRKLGFRELATFTIKRKNGINQSLFLGPGPEEDLNPYARIIVDEAHRRGIEVRVDDAEGGLFTLTQGGRQIRCRESLSDLTTAVSMTLCQDKVLTHRALQHAGLRQPQQRLAGSAEENAAFLAEHASLVVKPVDGEQGQGVAVDLRTADEVEEAIEAARHFDSRVLLESYHAGHDLRVLVIGYEVVAAAIRRPAAVIGDGRHSIRELIEAQSRRRQAATGGKAASRSTTRPSAPCGPPAMATTTCCPAANTWPCGAPPTCTPAASSRTSPTPSIRPSARPRSRPRGPWKYRWWAWTSWSRPPTSPTT